MESGAEPGQSRGDARTRAGASRSTHAVEPDVAARALLDGLAGLDPILEAAAVVLANVAPGRLCEFRRSGRADPGGTREHHTLGVGDLGRVEGRERQRQGAG